jgi:hypothetical protein
MINQNVLAIGAVAVVLLGLLGAANVYMIKPALQPTLPAIEPLPAAKESPPAVNSNVVAATLAQIKATEQSPAVLSATRQVSRNPFLWPGESTLPPEKPAAKPTEVAVTVEKSAPPQLKMILIGERKKMAVINDVFVFEGDKFMGSRVAKIEKDAVTLSGPEGKTRLVLGEISYAYMAEKLKEEKQKREALQKAQGPEKGKKEKATSEGMAQQEAFQRLMEKLVPLLKPPQEKKE